MLPKHIKKPKWYSKVKEITEEEARLLDSMGSVVYFDYYSATVQGWYSRYDICKNSTEQGFWSFYKNMKRLGTHILLFVLKGDDYEQA